MNPSPHRLGRTVTVLGIAGLSLVGTPSAALGGASQERVICESPLRVVGAQGTEPVTRLTLDGALYTTVKTGQDVLLEGFVLSGKLRVNVDLHRIDVFTEDARVVVGTARGDRPLPRPDVVLLGGHVVGVADSSVFLSLSPFGSNGLVRRGEVTHILSGGLHPGNKDTVVYDPTALPAGSIKWLDWTCRVDELLGTLPGHAEGTPRGEPGPRDAPCRMASVAVETDWEFTDSLFGGDTAASGAYAATLLGAVSEIYARDFNVTLQIGFLRLWDTSFDPWDQGDTVSQLHQFRDHWNEDMTGVTRHVAHFLSGRSLGGGVAYLEAVCASQYDYGLSADINGYFPYPLEHNHSQNWDPFVVAHELGHNFGAPHTHDMVPEIDGCGWGDCSVTPNGTIMSYCHTCPGGMTNIRLEFHQRMIDEAILPFLDYGASCDLVALPPVVTEQPADQSVCAGTAVTFTVVALGTKPFTFVWYKDGVEIPGVTTGTYIIDPVTPADAGVYDIVISNACYSQASEPATLAVSSSALGDFDEDCDVDLDDFAQWPACATGPGNGPHDSGCEPFDIDGDTDVDLTDFAQFQAAFTG